MPDIIGDGLVVPTIEELQEQRAAEEEHERATYAAVTNPAVLAALDVLAPACDGIRLPLFEWGHETTPTADEMIELAQQIVAAIARAAREG